MKSWDMERRTRAFFALAVSILIVVAVLAYQSIAAYVDNLRAVVHSYELLATVEALDTSINRGAAAVRAFLLTQDEAYVAEELAAYAAMEKSIARARQLSARNPMHLERIEKLQAVLDERRAIMIGNFQRRREEGIATGVAIMQQPAGNRLPAQSRLLVDQIQNAERDLLDQRAAADGTRMRDLVLAMTILLLAIAVIFYLLSRRIQQDLGRQNKMKHHADRNEAFLESVVENLPNMIFVKDAQDLRFVRVNAAGERLIGLPRTELLGKSDFDFWPREQAEFFVQMDREVLNGRRVIDIPEEKLQTQSGERLLHTKKVPITDANGKPLYLLGISEDITEAKKAEYRILQLNAHLRSRTAELEAANNELESFTYSVSHDLRTPLRAIGSFAHLLELEYAAALTGDAKRYIGIISAGTRRMSALIDDLLTFARLGRQALGQQIIDMDSLAQSAVQETLAGQEHGNACIEIAPLPPAFGDASMIKQVWVNLIGNALKYSKRHTQPHIVVKARQEDSQIVYSVTDNGVGFDMQYYGKLFGVFQRLHNIEDFPGTGVGLAIVHRVITRHGGRVWAHSEPGEGATFSFSLPVQSPALAHEPIADMS